MVTVQGVLTELGRKSIILMYVTSKSSISGNFRKAFTAFECSSTVFWRNEQFTSILIDLPLNTDQVAQPFNDLIRAINELANQIEILLRQLDIKDKSDETKQKNFRIQVEENTK